MKKNLAHFILIIGLLVAQTVSAEWVQTNGPGGGIINSLIVSGNNIFAMTFGGVYLSTNNGASWTLDASAPSANVFVVSGNNIFIGSAGVYLSTNNGISWTEVDSGITMKTISSLAISGSKIFAGTNGGGIFLSTNNGASWTAVNNGLPVECPVCKSKKNDCSGGCIIPAITSLVVSDSAIFAGTGFGIYRSVNNGTNWGLIDSTLKNINTLTISGNTIFANTASGVFCSTDNGESWTAYTIGLTNIKVTRLLISNNIFFAYTLSGGNFLSINKGVSWTSSFKGLTDTLVACTAVSGSSIFLGTNGGGIFQSTNGGASWTASNTGLNNSQIVSLALKESTIFAGTASGVFRSSNNGVSWIAVDSGLTNTTVKSFAISGNHIFAGTASGIFVSTNDAASWMAVDSGLTNTFINTFAVSGNNIFAGTDSGIFLSTNFGKSWIAVDSGLTNTFVNAFAVSGNNIFAGTASVLARIPCGIFLSTNNGSSWNKLYNGPEGDFTESGVSAFAVCDSTIIVGIYDNGGYLSTNNGAGWTSIPDLAGHYYNDTSMTEVVIYSFAVSGKYIFAATGRGIFCSTDNGKSWTLVDSTGLPKNIYLFDFYYLAVSDSTIFGGTSYSGIWRRPISEMVAINDLESQQRILQPGNLKILSQSRHNPNIAIEFSLTHSDQVAIKIYTLSGREIATLVNKILGAGEHRLSWDTKNIAAGCYAVKMQVGSNVYVKNLPVSR